MLVQVQPTTYRSPADGSEITINQVEVRCVSYTLNVGASAYFDLQNVDADGNATSYGLNGNNALTDAQFEAWGRDDAWFGRCIVENLGLTPVAP